VRALQFSRPQIHHPPRPDSSRGGYVKCNSRLPFPGFRLPSAIYHLPPLYACIFFTSSTRPSLRRFATFNRRQFAHLWAILTHSPYTHLTILKNTFKILIGHVCFKNLGGASERNSAEYCCLFSDRLGVSKIPRWEYSIQTKNKIYIMFQGTIVPRRGRSLYALRGERVIVFFNG